MKTTQVGDPRVPSIMSNMIEGSVSTNNTETTQGIWQKTSAAFANFFAPSTEAKPSPMAFLGLADEYTTETTVPKSPVILTRLERAQDDEYCLEPFVAGTAPKSVKED